MRQSTSKIRSRAVSRACVLTAMLNGVFIPGYAQEDYVQGLPVDQAPTSDFAEKMLRWGPFDLRPSLRAGVIYDNNIYIQSENEQEDVIWTITPGLLVGGGDYLAREQNFLTLFYAPSVILFTDNTDENSVDHDALLHAELREARWKLSLEQGYQLLSGAVIDVGGRADRALYSTHLAFSYEISPKTTVEATGRQMINDYERQQDFNEWTAGLAADYALTPKVKVGLGTVFGFLDVRGSANQTYQQLLSRFSYNLTEKVEAHATAGAELREFQGDADNQLDGVFSLGLDYKPLVNTTILAEAYRRNEPSVTLPDQNYALTGIRVGVRQRFREKYAFNLSGGYENSDYDGTETNVNADRQDDYYLVRAGLDWDVVERLVVGVFYLYRVNDSNSQYEFDNQQVGLAASYQF